MTRKATHENSEQLIVTYCLTKEQNSTIAGCLPVSCYRLFSTDCFTDIIAIPSAAVIINADELSKEETETLFGFYEEICNSSADTIIWLGGQILPKSLQRYVKRYGSFDELEAGLKYLLLDARKKQKKSSEFSNSVMYALRILAAIRKKPGITTHKLADDCEISTRSVQRYINTLRCSGEWIEYDLSLHGWKLFQGISMLMGDAFPEEAER